jgi:hypothetical protein
MRRSGQDTHVEVVYKKAFFTECYLSLRVKMVTYNYETLHKVLVTAMAPLNIEKECVQLSAAIAAFH